MMQRVTTEQNYPVQAKTQREEAQRIRLSMQLPAHFSSKQETTQGDSTIKISTTYHVSRWEPGFEHIGRELKMNFSIVQLERDLKRVSTGFN